MEIMLCIKHDDCMTSRLDVVRCLLHEAECDPNFINSDGETPLQLSSDIHVVMDLIQHGASVSHDEVVFIIRNIQDEHYANLLSVLIQDVSMDGNTVLCLACKADRPGFVHYLLSDCECNPNTHTAGETPLQSTSNPKIIKDLLQHGAVLDASDVLRWLTGTMDDASVLEIVEYLINKGIWDPNETIHLTDGNTLMHLACESNRPSVVHYLLSEALCYPNVMNSFGKTPIQLASNPWIIKDLANHGAEVDSDDHWWDDVTWNYIIGPDSSSLVHAYTVVHCHAIID